MRAAHRHGAAKPPCLGVAILAAGASIRMGCPKLLLPWNNTSVLGHLLSQWRDTGAEQIAVVCAPAHLALEQELDRLDFPRNFRIVNSRPERGMFSSIQSAARWSGWKAELTHCAISLGDQPHLRRETLSEVWDFARQRPEDICQPSRGGRARHPVVMPLKLFQELGNAPDENLKEFLRRQANAIARCEIDDPGLDLDMDTPADYDKAVAFARR